MNLSEIYALVEKHKFERKDVESAMGPLSEDDRKIFNVCVSPFLVDEKTQDFVRSILARNEAVPREKIVVHRYWNEIIMFRCESQLLNWLHRQLPCHYKDMPTQLLLSAMLIEYGNHTKIPELKGVPVSICKEPALFIYSYKNAFQVSSDEEHGNLVATDTSR